MCNSVPTEQHLHTTKQVLFLGLNATVSLRAPEGTWVHQKDTCSGLLERLTDLQHLSVGN